MKNDNDCKVLSINDYLNRKKSASVISLKDKMRQKRVEKALEEHGSYRQKSNRNNLLGDENDL